MFRNQARGTENKGKKEFVNVRHCALFVHISKTNFWPQDLLRSDFHKRFMVGVSKRCYPNNSHQNYFSNQASEQVRSLKMLCTRSFSRGASKIKIWMHLTTTTWDGHRRRAPCFSTRRNHLGSLQLRYRKDFAYATSRLCTVPHSATGRR